MIDLFLSIMLQHPLDQVCQELLRHHGRRDLFCIAALAQKLRLFLRQQHLKGLVEHMVLSSHNAFCG